MNEYLTIHLILLPTFWHDTLGMQYEEKMYKIERVFYSYIILFAFLPNLNVGTRTYSEYNIVALNSENIDYILNIKTNIFIFRLTIIIGEA